VIEAIERLESLQLLAPVVSTGVNVATFTAAATPTNPFLGTVTIDQVDSAFSPAGYTSVSELTSLAAFGGDMVRIEAAPGGDFGKGVYAISRGAGANADDAFRDPTLPAPINRPGVIYRVDPATGRSSVFFDLNTVLSQIDPGAPAGNGALPSTGLVNWYDIAFDAEGYFDGRPSMFVTSLSTSDPLKNVVYRIGPAGEFMGLFIRFDPGQTPGNLAVQPSAIHVPPARQQTFLRGLFVGDADNSGDDAVLFFDANVFRPGQTVLSLNTPGVSATPMTFGPQVGITSAQNYYPSPVYDAFTDFGQPAIGELPPAPGLSGVQGLLGDLLIGSDNTLGLPAIIGSPVPTDFVDELTTPSDGTVPSGVDSVGALSTDFRRFQDIAFDEFGYFSYGQTVTGPFGNATVGDPPIYSGSLFVTDLATGLSVAVTPVDPLATDPIAVPIQGPGAVGVELGPDGVIRPIVTNGNTTGGSNIGGRVVRIGPDGTITPFAEGFHTTGEQGATSFLNSTLSITFSADGTTMYVSDMDGIWQFKTVTSLAGSTSGSLVGLNDLRSLGVPYQGQDLAVAVVDTGVDAVNPLFNGQVARGKNVITNGRGDDDTAAITVGHGTELAGVISQFVPQATIVPVNVFTPGQGSAAPTLGGATSQTVYDGMNYVSSNPYVQDPVRTNTLDRVVAAAFGFGTATSFQTEGVAYRRYPQIVLAMKTQMKRFRDLKIAPIAASGQFGSPAGTPAGAATVGDTRGESLPAVLNEVISVSGVYSFPYEAGPDTPPTDPPVGALPRPRGPVLVTTPGGTFLGDTLPTLTAPDAVIFQDRLLGAANRTVTTDYVAPAVNVPTFSRTAVGVTTTDVASATATGFMVFQEGGTSLSAGMVTGSYAIVASALNYWSNLANSGGVTADGYLNTPVGTHVLNFGPHTIADLSTYQNPDSVNSILQWTAVPARDEPTTADVVNVDQLYPNAGGPYPRYSRIDVGNAVASIEGTVALNYLINHGSLDIIDANHNGLITAQEIQDFTDNSATIGLPEAGAMARMLGGTARIPTTGALPTAAGEFPDQPDVLQRRYNYFDYAADGQLDGVVSIDQFKMLVRTLLPSPDAFTIVDRQRSSANGYLLSPDKDRNYVALQYLKPQYVFVPPSAVRKFHGISPRRFGVNKGLIPSDPTLSPQFTLFGPSGGSGGSESGNNGGNGGNGGSGGNQGGSGGNQGGSGGSQGGGSGGSQGGGSGGSQGGSGGSQGGSGGSNSSNGGSNSSKGGSSQGTTGNSNGSNQSNGSNSNGNQGQQALDEFLSLVNKGVSGNNGSTTGTGTSAGKTEGQAVPSADEGSTVTGRVTPDSVNRVSNDQAQQLRLMRQTLLEQQQGLAAADTTADEPAGDTSNRSLMSRILRMGRKS
jgi:hypothetical protein